MSDPDVPKDEKPNDVNDVVDSANAGLAEAEAAGADVPDATADTAPDARVDPDLAAFEEAERDYPGTFSAAQAAEAAAASRADAETSVVDDATASETRVFPAAHVHEESAMADAAYTAPVNDAETRVVPSEPVSHAGPAAADLRPGAGAAARTRQPGHRGRNRPAGDRSASPSSTSVPRSASAHSPVTSPARTSARRRSRR